MLVGPNRPTVKKLDDLSAHAVLPYLMVRNAFDLARRFVDGVVIDSELGIKVQSFDGYCVK